MNVLALGMLFLWKGIYVNIHGILIEHAELNFMNITSVVLFTS